MDPNAYRQESRKRWGTSAAGWRRHNHRMRRLTMPVTTAMVDAVAPQPGHRILELAAGTGEVGFLALELAQPGGSLITSDFSPEMLSAAQERAGELGLANVRFKQIDAESIDLEAGSQDAVLCRWGYMLMADPEAALRETRRVLRPGGRLALAAWTAGEENPWSALIGEEIVRRGLAEAPAPGEPGQFAWGREGVIREQLEAVGFDDVEVQRVAFEMRYADVEDWLATQTDLSSRVADALAAAPDRREEVFAALREAAAPYVREDGSVAMPAASWVAAASA